MRGVSAFAGSITFVTVLATISPCQVAQRDSSTSQVRREFAIGKALADGVEKKDASLEDAEFVAYVQGISNRVANAAGKIPLEIHVTTSNREYAQLLAGTLYISGALLGRIENEAELAGLLAHQLAHGSGLLTRQSSTATIPLVTPACALASPGPATSSTASRDSENHATLAAVEYLKLAGYDPMEMLGLLSKLSYEHPLWSKAIDPDDVLDLRVKLESESEPSAGYRINTSEFNLERQRLAGLLKPEKKALHPTMHSPPHQNVH